ncbi:MAG: hypothetical protein Q4C18_06045 [Eubacteriales bacterium]|nr:hypothetical protein [Eubacteriales bacterium]
MRNVDYVLDMVVLVASIAFGIVFMVAMDAVSAHSGAQIVLMILEIAAMGIFGKTSYQMLQ